MFYPTHYAHRLYEIDIEKLKKAGIRCVILDVDNTLTTHDNPNIDPKMVAWLEKAQSEGLILVILSNNSEERVKPFAQKVGLLYESHAGKPRVGGYQRVFQRFSVKPQETVAIGDQIFTDILGGNRAGVMTILVQPIELETTRFFKLKRALERALLKRKGRTL